MATAPAISTRSLPSFEGLRPSTVRVSLVGVPLRASVLTQRPVRGLVVRAATSIAPKVFHLCPRRFSWEMVDKLCFHGLAAALDENFPNLHFEGGAVKNTDPRNWVLSPCVGILRAVLILLLV